MNLIKQVNRIENLPLYLVVLAGSLFLVFAATGGGLTGTSGYWQHSAFESLCHQDPTRSFIFSGKQMAVCSRCYGIYSGFTLLWLILPLLGIFMQKINSSGKIILLVSVIANFVDVTGNLMGIWQNTLISRLLLGGAIGIAVVIFLSSDFNFLNQQHNELNYGTVTESE